MDWDTSEGMISIDGNGKWGIYYWFGMYITINYIAMMMGGSIDSTIY